jgi:hypothetical protein
MQFYEHKEGPPELLSILSILSSPWQCPLRITVLKASVSVVWVAGPLDVRSTRFPPRRRLDLFSVICSDSKAQVSIRIAASPFPAQVLNIANEDEHQTLTTSSSLFVVSDYLISLVAKGNLRFGQPISALKLKATNLAVHGAKEMQNTTANAVGA